MARAASQSMELVFHTAGLSEHTAVVDTYTHGHAESVLQ